MKKWICSQFSAREKYAIPRALQELDLLEKVYTDLWLKPGSIVEYFNKRAKGRFHADLAQADVVHFNRQFLYLKLKERIYGKRNSYGEVYDSMLRDVIKKERDAELNFFGYSYSSRKSFKVAKDKGFTTILGQINPGPKEAEIVVEAFKRFRGNNYKPSVPSAEYWDLWREEVSYADRLIVNSKWAKELLLADGVSADKCVLVPLAYETKKVNITRLFKRQFERNAPLTILYLGGVGIRKGFHLLVEAMEKLINEPVHLDVVGGLNGPSVLITDLPSNITYHGPVAPHEVDSFYRNSDVFIFPTLSDGFGLTQLEAQAYRLPMISSKYCAPVITNGENGIILQEVDASNIVAAIYQILADPALLEVFSHNAIPTETYSMQKLADRLLKLG